MCGVSTSRFVCVSAFAHTRRCVEASAVPDMLMSLITPTCNPRWCISLIWLMAMSFPLARTSGFFSNHFNAFTVESVGHGIPSVATNGKPWWRGNTVWCNAMVQSSVGKRPNEELDLCDLYARWPMPRLLGEG